MAAKQQAHSKLDRAFESKLPAAPRSKLWTKDPGHWGVFWRINAQAEILPIPMVQGERQRSKGHRYRLHPNGSAASPLTQHPGNGSSPNIFLLSGSTAWVYKYSRRCTSLFSEWTWLKILSSYWESSQMCRTDAAGALWVFKSSNLSYQRVLSR